MRKILRTIIHYTSKIFLFSHLSHSLMLGVKIGKNTMISLGAKIDIHRGKVIIGDNSLITFGVKIVSHGGASRMIDINDFGNGEIAIGNNVFC